jgi:hypothetical protein
LNITIVIGECHRAVEIRGSGAHMNAGDFSEFGPETQTRGRIMVAGNKNHRDFRDREVTQGLGGASNGIDRWHGSIEYVPGDQYRDDILLDRLH